MGQKNCQPTTKLASNGIFIMGIVSFSGLGHPAPYKYKYKYKYIFALVERGLQIVQGANKMT